MVHYEETPACVQPAEGGCPTPLLSASLWGRWQSLSIHVWGRMNILFLMLTSVFDEMCQFSFRYRYSIKTGAGGFPDAKSHVPEPLHS